MENKISLTEILKINAKFYVAFEGLSIDIMNDLWKHTISSLSGQFLHITISILLVLEYRRQLTDFCDSQVVLRIVKVGRRGV
jgi:hypothetical protein